MCKCNDCANKETPAEELEFFLDGTIDEVADDVVTISREEYVDLISAVSLLDTIERWIKAHRHANRLDPMDLMILLGAKEEKA